eukprot:6050138-Amphidinium_carterae.1
MAVTFKKPVMNVSMKKPAASTKKPACFNISTKKGTQRLLRKPVTNNKIIKKPVTRPYTVRLEPKRQRRCHVYWNVSLVELIQSSEAEVFQ